MTVPVTVTLRAMGVLLALLAAALFVDIQPAAAADHSVFAYGSAPFHGSTGNAKLNEPVVGMARNADGSGYWLASKDGRVYAFGAAASFGSLDSAPPSPVVGIAATPAGDGYWVVTASGSVYTFGAAPFLGGLGGTALKAPIVGITARAHGVGYWLVASDGGIFSFGDAQFLGSTGAMRLNQPIAGMASTPSGRGYWLVARDGGIFTFGTARFLGSTGGIRLARSIVGMAATPSGKGYWLVAADGGPFTFGDAPFLGSLGGGGLTEPAVGVVGAPTGKGYWLVTTGHLAPSASANKPQLRIHPGSYKVSAFGPVVPGTYREEQATAGCTWERRGSASGAEGAVLATRRSDDRQVVTIKPGDQLFRTSGCAPFVNDLFPITARLDGDFGNGTWIVGIDIAPGTWTATGGSDCIWERVADFSGDAGALMASDSGVDHPVVDIKPGDAGFVSSDCGTWVKG